MTHIIALTPLRLACAMAFAAASGASIAQTAPLPPAYVTSADGSVVTSGTGLCVHADSGSLTVPNNPCVPRPAPVVMVPADLPAPVAAPAPVVVAAAPPARPEPPVLARMTFDADALFDFDKSALRPAGQLALDKFIGEVKGIDAGTITAIGYTDRIGTDAYNQSLSDQRAETVRAYLQSGGIDPGNMHSEGRGNTQPVTKSGQCDGEQSAKVIACLQPDRRVEVEVTGTAVALATPR